MVGGRGVDRFVVLFTGISLACGDAKPSATDSATLPPPAATASTPAESAKAWTARPLRSFPS
jgi:hypothetical protein